MTQRRLFLDEGPGETRGVVTAGGVAERLLIRREGDDPRLRLGARLAAVAVNVEPSLSTAFLDLGGGAQAVLPFKAEDRPVRGAVLEVEIRGEPRRGKLASARLLGPAQGAPRLLAEAPSLADVLRGFAKDAELVVGRAARAAADEAEAEALATLHVLPGGGVLAIEPTRALTAVDVDLGDRKGADAKRVTRAANLAAIALCARLLRLKGLGGLVVIDLAGRGHDPAALAAAARVAFGPDNPGVSIGGVGRFGALELSLPRRARPIAELLVGEDGRPTAETLALRLLRRIESEAQAQPGARLAAACAPSVAAAAEAFAPALAARIGARFQIRPDPARAVEELDVAGA